MTCATCATELATANVLYDVHGNVTCGKCLLASESDALQWAASKTLKSNAYAGPVIGIAAMFFNPALCMSVVAIVIGVYVLRAVRRPDTASHLGEAMEKVKVGAIAGMVLGGITAVLGIMNMAAK
jgi:hypothetical protein